MKRKCNNCGKKFIKTGKYETICYPCWKKSNKRNRHRNSLAKMRRKVFSIIMKSEWIHPKVRSQVVLELKKELKKWRTYV